MDCEISNDYALYKPEEHLSRRERLVLENLRLVLHFAFKFRRNQLRFLPDHDDLTQEGMLGLLRAANWSGRSRTRFDPKKGRFTTWSGWWIRQAILRAIYQGGVGYGGQRPHQETQLLSKSEDIALVDPPSQADPVAALELEEDLGRLDAAMRHLTPREADVIRRRWGLGGTKKETLLQISRRWRRSRERIRQVEKIAIAKLRKLMEEKPKEVRT